MNDNPIANDIPARTTIWPAVRFVVSGYWRSLVTMVLGAFLGGTAEAAFLVIVTRTAFAITKGADEVGLIAGRYLPIGWALGAALALVCIRVGFALVANVQAASLSSSAVARIRHNLARAFLGASWRVQQSQAGGSLQEFISSYTNQATTMMAGLNTGMIAAANLAALICLAVAVDPLGALTLVISVAVLGLALRPLRAVIHQRSRALTRTGMDMAVSVNEVSDLGLELHVFQVQDAAAERVDSLIDRTRHHSRRLMFTQGLATPLYIGMSYLAVIAALGLVALSSTLNLASLGAAMLVMLRSLSYGQAVQGAYVTLSSASPVMEILQDQLNGLEAGRQHDGCQPVDRIQTITADDITFAYIADQNVLHGISFTVEPREIVGIVGPSGGGKSTLVQLLLGIREPSTGHVLADGRDIAGFDKAQWARKMTFVPQESHLITGTIAENIRFLRDGFSDDDVEQAARKAHLHDEIVGFPEGYERRIGASGGHLSGGQKQRLCIARALIENPDVLILDEPTSALDVRSEHLVRTTLQGLRDEMTVIIIAHRLSTLDICDRIMVIQDGHLKGFGTPGRLRQSSDFYSDALRLSGLT